MKKDIYNRRVWASKLNESEFSAAYDYIESLRQERKSLEHSLGLATCKEVAPAKPGKQKEETETTMYTENKMAALSNVVNASDIVIPDTMETTQKKFLKAEAYKEYTDKIGELQVKFGLTDDPRPRSARQLIDAIKNDKFVVSPFEIDQDSYYCPLDAFRFRDPAVKYDEAGYKAARKELDNLLTETSYAVMLKDNDAGLAAVRSIKAFQPTVASA